MKLNRKRNKRNLVRCFVALLMGLLLINACPAANAQTESEERFMETIQAFSSHKDRSTGTRGAKESAKFIKKRFSEIGLGNVGSQLFSIPILGHDKSTITLPDQKLTTPIHPLRSNAISPETISPEGLFGPLVYVGHGELKDFNGKQIAGAIIIMEMESGKNWLHAASLGAKALLYVDRGLKSKTFFSDKLELTPIQFPRFWLPYAKAVGLFGHFERAENGLVSPQIRLDSDNRWKVQTGENIYGMIEGSDPVLKEELIIVEAFYDSEAWVTGNSPGADEACGIATLLDLAQRLKNQPPGRSILLVATDGHAHTLAGMRELIWSIRERSKNLRRMKRKLRNAEKSSKEMVKLLKQVSSESGWDKQAADAETGVRMKEAITEQIKSEVDIISRQLMRLRMQDKTDRNIQAIEELTGRRLLLRRLVWKRSVSDIPEDEKQIAMQMVAPALKNHQAIVSDARSQQKNLKSTTKLRAQAKSKELAAVISLHLSSHGDGVGAFNQGWLHALKPIIDRINAYSTINEALRHAAAAVEPSVQAKGMFKDTLRPSRRRPWQSYFMDRPQLGAEISSMARYVGVSLVTVNDARPLWGTPYDFPDAVNSAFAAKQSALVCGIIQELSRAPALHTETMPRDGFSTVTGRVNFLRHGELFADQPAPGSMILSYQNTARYYNMVDAMGNFMIKGVADKKHTLHKIIIEAYRFDPATGETIWAVDKQKTGKQAYRVKMQRRSMETDLVMFACKQTTLFDLLEPRNFRYMTRIHVLDGRRESPPLRYWWSRIDTWKSTLLSICLESGVPLKMTLSDSVLQKKLILTHATESDSQGIGYLIDDWPKIHRTQFRVAKDMWSLLSPRIENLEIHGIYNDRIRTLQDEGIKALETAARSLGEKKYDRFFENAKRSWALASRVYDHVEKTQKDVLFGVLFYIALFVPFAFCMERLLFGYSDIYKRIIAFSGILITLIVVIYRVHPAFQLAYSPMVVIIAFFIMGLSLMVTLIIFFRFEEEMTRIQRRAQHFKTDEVSRWKAFVASFMLGVSNLKRRRLRTGLTCATLVILTFTIMSFTSVKSMQRHARLRYQPTALYQGFLLKNVNWKSLPPEALEVFHNAFEEEGIVVPRVWLEAEDKTQTTRIPIRYHGRVFEAQGLIGLSANETEVTGLNRILVGGRWFKDAERNVVILPVAIAKNLGIDPMRPQGNFVAMWGIPFEVIGTFSGQDLQNLEDLDGEPLTPVTFPSEISAEITEAEMDALESGEDIEAFQSRYQHIAGNLTVMIPYKTLLAGAGNLKAVAIRPVNRIDYQKTAQDLVDRFGLALFSGEQEGTFLYNASEAMSYSGVPNIIIPLIISVFIVLNTMIGSVYERKREIAIYTSVGLAPSHVSFLFIAESLAFAVISVVLGYLLAQTTASLFAGTTLWAGITVNYSSTAGVAAMVLVIMVVLVSVIYPSKLAADIAIPDVNRSWKLPEPQNNALDLTLPFLMKYHEHQSVGGYILDYFQSHQDVTHGIFSTDDIEFRFVCPTLLEDIRHAADVCSCGQCVDTCLGLHCKIWLAPFDFGIMQDIEVQFCPAAEDVGYHEIRIRLIREAGEANMWLRINKGFLLALRKQLLVWRSLDDDSRTYYENLLISTIQANGAELPTPEES